MAAGEQTDAATLRQRIDGDYINALKARDTQRLSALRMLRAAIQSADKANREPLSDDDLIGVVGREAKVRRESLGEFERGNRPDLVAAEREALDVLGQYLPSQLSDAELREYVRAAVQELAPEARDNPRQALGLVMRAVMPDVKGRAEGERVGVVASELLAARERS